MLFYSFHRLKVRCINAHISAMHRWNQVVKQRSLCILYQILSKSVYPQRRYDVISIFKMVATAAQFYFRFQIGRRRSFSDVSFYHQTKFRSYNSIRGWDITISGFEKQTYAILEFNFRFRFRPYHCSRHVMCSAPVCKILSKSDRPRQSTCRFSRWWISAVLDFRGSIMGSFKSPCTTSYRSSI